MGRGRTARRAGLRPVAAGLGFVAAATLAGCSALSVGGNRAAPSASAGTPLASPTTTSETPEPTASTGTPGPSGWAGVFAAVSSGVVRIAVLQCAADGPAVASGSGLLLSPTEVLTVAHVPQGATDIAVRAGGQVTGARVRAWDPVREVAVLRLDRALTGHVFGVPTVPPAIGDDVAAIGYPHGQPVSLTRGVVSGLGRRIAIGGRDLRDLGQMDVPISPGNSGGPVVDARGNLVGLTEAERLQSQNVNYFVTAPTAAHVVTQYRAGAAGTMPGPRCDTRLLHDGVPTSSTHPDAPTIATTFDRFYTGINQRDYEYAFDLLTARVQHNIGGMEGFTRGQRTSIIARAALSSVQVQDDVTDAAVVDMVSTQVPEGGTARTCTRWRLRYILNLDSGQWAIDRATALDGTPKPCDAALATAVGQRVPRVLDGPDGD